MSDSVASTHFGPDHAAAYDTRWSRFAPAQQALHLLMQAVLGGLPADAHVLSVGAGTGAEMLALARAFPGWRFTAVEPSPAMLGVCRRKVEEAGLAARCTLHEGYLTSLPEGAPFDAATSILVSQFLAARDERIAYFREIARRLRPGGLLIEADLSTALEGEAFDGLVEVWLRAQSGTSSPEAVRALQAGWAKSVAVSTPAEVEALLAAGGFEGPVLFHQAIFIHAWYARAAGLR